MGFMRCITFLLAWTAIYVHAGNYVDTDTVTTVLDDLEVRARRVDKFVSKDGRILNATSTSIKKFASVLGESDPFRMFGMQPQVRTSDELSPGLSVQGADPSANFYTADGFEVLNPQHLLGIFSSFNTSYFSQFSMTPTGHPAYSQNYTGALFSATGISEPDTTLRGAISAGILASQGALSIPLSRGKSSIRIGLRATYLNLLFPDILKYDHAKLKYGFEDYNASLTQKIGTDGLLKASVLISIDRMRLTDSHYDTEGKFGWKNLSSGISYTSSHWSHSLSYSWFDNGFRMEESGKKINLPSSVGRLNYSVLFGNKKFKTGLSQSVTSIREQFNKEEITIQTMPKQKVASETSLAIDFNSHLSPRMELSLGLRGTLYVSDSLTHIYPMPRMSADYAVSDWLSVGLDYGVYMHFSHFVCESNTGLPANFMINASRRFKPTRSHSLNVRLVGHLQSVGMEMVLEAFGKLMSHVCEYNGSILNMISSDYSPLNDLYTGRGRSGGISLTISKNTGNLRGWIGYCLSRSECKLPGLGAGWFPSDHDRLHDFNVALSWDVNDRISLGATYVYASGNPYTSPKYGYMIGENLICEYERHNSSRLPPYRRLDLSAVFDLGHTGKIGHNLSVSVYNVLFNHNIIFRYVTYSPKHGIYHKDSALKTAIPGISYTLIL